MLPAYLIATKGYGWTIHDIEWCCPCDLEPYLIAKHEEEIAKDADFHLQGRYMAMAIASCFSKDFKYPEQPLYAQAEKTARKDDKQAQIDAFVMSMQTMAINWKANHSNNENNGDME